MEIHQKIKLVYVMHDILFCIRSVQLTIRLLVPIL